MKVAKKVPQRIELRLALLLFSCCSGTFAQQTRFDSLLSAFKSPDPGVRMDAFEEAKENRTVLARSDIRAALVDLLDRENRLIHATLVESQGRQGVAIKYGEDYADYATELMGTVAETIDWSKTRDACVLAESAYGANTSFTDLLISKAGSRIVPCLLELAQGNRYGTRDSGAVLEMDRVKAVSILFGIESTSTDLTAAQREELHDVTDQGLRDPSASVRPSVVGAIGRYGTPEIIPRLQEQSAGWGPRGLQNRGQCYRFWCRILSPQPKPRRGVTT